MADWADLTSTVRRTKGDCPPPLVGASVTLVGDSIYVFGGRPVHSREMVNSLYALDLRSLAWAKLWPSPAAATARGPAPRYFHSAQAWGDKLVVFGGQSFVAGPGGPGAQQQGRLETLDELVVFDTRTHAWSFPSPSLRAGVSRPSPRYAHLSVVTTAASRPSPGFAHDPATHSSRLVVIGGQDFENNYLPDLAVLNLDAMEWIAEAPYPRKAGTYRSVAAAAPLSVRPREERMGSDGALLVHSAHAVEPTEDREEPVWVYSNSNFASPRRDLDLLPTVHDALTTPAYLSLSDAMHGDPALPPGLRFPHAYLCGRHLVLSGAHVGVNRAEFVVWTLDLGAHDPLAPGKGALVWSALPLEKVLGRGSWGPAVGWRNTLVVVGDAGRDMMEDYNARQTNFTQVAFVDLEGFGVYVPPPQPIPAVQQQLSLMTMAQPQLFDYELICGDKERLGCSRKLLDARWPWFADELRAVEAKASAAVEAREQRTTTGSGAYGDSSDEEPIDGALSRVASPVPPKRQAQPLSTPARAPSRLFPITARSLELPLPSSDVKALLQYFHTLSLSTAQQRSLPVLTSLLAFTKTYDSILPSLRALVVHALHETLSVNPDAGAKVYEAAALGDSVALQIRAMQTMLNARRASVSTAHSVEPRRTSSQAEPARFSDHSQVSSMSNLSAYSGFDNELSSPYNRSSAGSSAGPGTPASSIFAGHSTSYQPPSSPVPPIPPQASSLPPLSSHPGNPPAPYSTTTSPNLSLPVVGGSPFFGGAAPRGASLPSRNGSVSAALDISHYSTHSSPSPIPPTSPLPAAPQQPRRASSPSPSIGISSSTPARIAEAWREGEERDRRQRAEAARLAAEADLARGVGSLRLGGGDGRGSVSGEGSGRKASVASAQTLGSIPESAYGPLNGALNGGGFASSPTPSLGGGGGAGSGGSAGDAASIRTSGSRESSGTKHSSEKAAAVATKAAETTAKVVKKGLFSGFMGPTIHNAGTAKKAPTGPAPKRAYPRPTPRTAKGAQALARLDDQFEQASSGSSSASFRS
ncbi:hypothetical protein JCM10450v2_007785 [Rhodotorula kratochvilovae]